MMTQVDTNAKECPKMPIFSHGTAYLLPRNPLRPPLLPPAPPPPRNRL